ncbi:outer membrane beta-barrel protein [Pedobacter sp. SYSU D00535]|uniref:outer membrane beta-barrel protein n=1 Tax=Pedobacter sp. SYSU D00535 TaxID=2810308 RepID=UPI001A95D058|nr:outer membrane beta-barrel protein [Pedobacter sp. SYSU D00535]
MLKKLLAIAAIAGTTYAQAQDTTSTSSPLEISGSVDAYYKYDFSGFSNIPTSFVSDQNSVSIGMIDVALRKTTGKASFVGEVSFGPRGQYQSLPNSDDSYGEGNGFNSFHIQNLYATYAFTDRFSMTAGYMGTFVGYEVISPVGNFNYSTSYLFTNGPFQNAGVKANFAFTDKVGLMVGLFNDSWNVYSANPSFGVSTFGAQLSLAPVEGWNAYLNLLTGYPSGTVVDLTTAYQITDKFKLGLNAADYSLVNDGGGYSGIALYPQVSVTEGFALGLRGEYFKAKTGADMIGADAGESVTSLTVSGNLKSGGLTFIPEFRVDNSSVSQFMKENGSATKSASQFSLALVYAF